MQEEDDAPRMSPFTRRMDISPPVGRSHPEDRTIDVLSLVRAGILTDEDVRTRRAFTREELEGMMARLAA